MLKFMSTLSCICLLMAITSVAQPPSPILDTAGKPLQRGVKYYILPGVTDIAGGLTFITRNASCPLYVGQEKTATSQGLPVIFTPFLKDEKIIRESRDFKIEFAAATTCIQSTAWRVGETAPQTDRRLIVTGGDSVVSKSNPGGRVNSSVFFRISSKGGRYNLAWCPTDTCETCRFICGSAGILVENGKRLLALDAPNAFPFVFGKA